MIYCKGGGSCGVEQSLYSSLMLLDRFHIKLILEFEYLNPSFNFVYKKVFTVPNNFQYRGLATWFDQNMKESVSIKKYSEKKIIPAHITHLRKRLNLGIWHLVAGTVESMGHAWLGHLHQFQPQER